MNGVRSTFMRRGYLLTALSALLLLAASAGTASAQGVGFVGTSGSVDEDASASAMTPALLRITVSVNGVPGGPTGNDPDTGTPTPRQRALDAIGAVTYTVNDAAGNPVSEQIAVTPQGELSFLQSDTVMLTVTPLAAGDANWKNETYSIKLSAAGTSVAPSPGVFTVTVVDDEIAPVAIFDKASIRLTEDSNTTVGVRVTEGARSKGVPDITAFTGTLQFTVSPAAAVGLACSPMTTNAVAITEGATVVDARRGIYATTAVINTLGAVPPAPAPTSLAISACPDMSNYRGTTVTVGMVARSLMNTTVGDITPGANLSIMIESDEPVPTLSFSPTDVTINEGESVETVLLAEGEHGDEVGMVKLMVEGDAMVSLMHGDKMLEEMDGHVYVDLGDSNAARLTAMSHESRELADGDMAYKAWKLVEGSTDGAMIGEGSWFKVDVVGSTAVPALPLIGQLLLALFLMAGGSRLYRRRQE